MSNRVRYCSADPGYFTRASAASDRDRSLAANMPQPPCSKASIAARTSLEILGRGRNFHRDDELLARRFGPGVMHARPRQQAIDVTQRAFRRVRQRLVMPHELRVGVGHGCSTGLSSDQLVLITPSHFCTPLGGGDVADVLGERPPVPADVFRGVLADAERHVLGLLENRRARRLRPWRKCPSTSSTWTVRVLRDGAAALRGAKWPALLADHDRALADVHLRVADRAAPLRAQSFREPKRARQELEGLPRRPRKRESERPSPSAPSDSGSHSPSTGRVSWRCHAGFVARMQAARRRAPITPPMKT